MDPMNKVFKNYIDKFIEVFNNDILKKFNKYEFWLEKITFLGHVVPKDGIAVNPLKVELWANSLNQLM